MKKKALALILMLGLSSTLLTGCFASWGNQVAKDGSLFGTNKGDYIVVNYAGTKIVDVWKLKNQFVESESSSDGWGFKDNKGNFVMVGGDAKTIRVNDDATWNAYVEYHYETDGGEYPVKK